MNQDERLLIQQARQGDEDAFASLYMAHAPRLYGLSLRMCQNEADAQDAVQEAMVKAWRNLPAFRFQSELGTWLYRIAMNCCRDILRRRKKPAVSMETLQETGVEIPQEGFEERTVQRDELTRALAKMDDKYREIIILREIQGLSYEEVAQVLRLPVGTVRSRLNRARAQLRSFL